MIGNSQVFGQGETSPITVSTNKSIYEDGDFLIISGTATPNEELDIWLVDSNNNIISQTTITVDSTGSYSVSLETWNSSQFVFDEYAVGVWSLIDDRSDILFISFVDTTPVVTIVSTIITLDSIPSSISLDYGPFIVTGKLTTTDGTPISGKPVWMQANSDDGRGQGGDAITDSNGYFDRELYFWHEADPGNWEVYVYFEGDADYDFSSSASRYITVEAPVPTTTATIITLDSIPSSIPLYDSISVSGMLTAIDGTPISGKPVWIEAESSSDLYNSVDTTTDSNGYFESVLSFQYDDDVGNWNVYAGFQGDSDYDFSMSTSRYITVEPTVTTVPITISINKSTYEDGDFLLVSGTATPNEELEIILFDYAENVVAREFITVDSSGSYSTSLETFDSTYMVFGEYGVLAASQTDDRYNVVYFDFIDTTPVETPVTPTPTNFGATIELDQRVYTTVDTVYITIVAPDFNDSNLIDLIGSESNNRVTISTSIDSMDYFTLVETGRDTGIFIGEILLRDEFLINKNGLLTSPDDQISILFSTSYFDVIATAMISWNIGDIQWIDSNYSINEIGKVRVIDPDLNFNTFRDNVSVNVYSDSDPNGIDIILTETGDAHGIFEGNVSFTTTRSGMGLFVDGGDTITAVYLDYTLPNPYTPYDSVDITTVSSITGSPTVEPTVETTSSTNITLDSVTPNVKSGDSLFVSGKLTTSDGYPVSGKPIWLTINDEDGEGTGIFVTTNSNGQFETNFDITSGMKISDWTVQAFFDGDTNYFASVSNYRYFTVGSTNVSLTHTTLTFDYISPIQSGDSVILTGSLNTLDGTPISGKTILITIYPDNGGTGHGEYVTTNNNGNFVLDFYTTSDEDVGGWTVDAEFIGDVDYFPSSNNSQSFIVEESTIISPKPITESDAGTLTVDSAKYQVSRYNPVEVHFSGIVFEYNKGFTVLVDVQYPNGETLTQKILVSSDESFSVSIFLDDDDPVGVYTINAKYRDREFSPLTFTLDKVPEDVLPDYPPTNYSADIIISQNTGVPGCEILNNCYSPYSLSVNVGDTVEWYNADSAVHTVNHGSPSDDWSISEFNSDLLMSGESFFHTFENGGTFDYFDIVHPWMMGTVQVNESETVEGGPENAGALGSAHVHAGILVKIFGDEFDFSAPAYQIKSPWIHFEERDGATIHRHATGVELEYLFNSLSMGLDDQCFVFPDGQAFCTTDEYSLKYFINEKLVSDIRNYVIQEDDEILITFDGETTLTPVVSNTILTLDPLPPSINTGESIIFSGRLVTSDGVPISKQTILIKDDDSFGLDDLVAKAVTDSSGYYKNTIIAKNWDATSGGASEIYAVFDGTDIYPGDRTLIYEINVKSGIKNTSIIFDKLPKTATEGELIIFSGQLLTDEGIPLEGKTIYLKQDIVADSDNLFATLTTDGNGYFMVEKSFMLPKYAEKLDANFYIKWDGDDKNNSFRTSNQKITLTTSDPVKNTTVTLDPLPNKITEGESITFSGQLLTTDGIPLEGRTIYIKDDYDFDTDSIIKKTTTDSNGKFSISWSATVRSSGSYDFYAVFEGEEKAKRDRSLTYGVYVTAIVSFEPIRVFSDESIFEIGDSLVIYGDATPNEELQIALMDSNENLITSKTIQVSSSGSYSTTLYNWKQSTAFGDYVVVAWSEIDQRYDGFWISFIEGVPQVSETKITLDRPPSSIVLNEPITFSGKLTTVDGSPIKNGHVIIATLTAQTPESLAEGYTDSSGRYSITWYAKQTSSSGLVPVYAYYGGNQVLDSTVTSLYDIKIEKPSLSVFTEKSTYETGEQLLAYGYGNPNDRITVELKSAQGKVVNSEYSIVSSDGNYHTFFNLDNLSNGQYTIKVTSALYAISDSVSIQVESKIVTDEIDITGNVHYNYNKIPLAGIKAVLDIGAQQHVDYADSAGNFEFENIGFNSQLDYTLHFEMTDGKSFNFVDGEKFDADANDNYEANGEVISSNSIDLPLDNSKSTNYFSINLGDHLPYDYSKSSLITKGFDTQTKIVNFYSKVLNERPPIINIFLFGDSGAWYQSTEWDPSTNKVMSGYWQPRINVEKVDKSIMSSFGMEYTHYAQDYAYKKMNGYDTSPKEGNHHGFNNPSTADSWVEGVGSFMPAVIADWENLSSAGTFSGINLERNDLKPTTNWNKRSDGVWLAEEYSIATLLWDMYDSENEQGDNTTMRINEIWKLIKGFDSFQQHNPSDYHGDKRNIKYFKDFYDYLYDESNMSGDNIDDLFISHGIPQGWSAAGRP